MTSVTAPEAASEQPEFGKLTPAGLEAFRGKIGVDWPYDRWTTWNELRRATGSVTTPTASATTTRCGAIPITPRKHDGTASSPRRDSSRERV
jgi:hypothetical protein